MEINNSSNTGRLPGSHGGRSFRLLAIILIMIGLGLVIGLAWLGIGGKSLWRSAGPASPTPSVSATTNSAVTTSCYELTISRAINKGLDFGCELDFSYGSSDQNSFTISGLPLPVKADGTLDASAGFIAYKSSLAASGVKIVSEEATELGKSSARKLLIQPVAKGQALVLFVANRNPNVTNTKGVLTTGLVIEAAYFTPEQTEVVDTALASWQWKSE